MTDDIVTRLRDERWVWVSELALRQDAADEIERLRDELRLCTAERDHHLKWSRTYELELRELRGKKKNLDD